jgi:hypothetical protein
MMNLLVNTPTGKQELLTIGPGGGYFDASRVIWDTRTDGALPSITLGGMVRNGDALAFDQARMDQHTAASAPPVPQAVTMRQARLALLGAGLLTTVNAAITGMSGAAGDAARIEWEFSSEVRRQQPLVLALAPALSLSDAQLDALFVAAAAL